MEVAAREHGLVFGKHQRVVGDGIGLNEQHAGCVAQLVQASAHHLRLAAQAIRVLHPVVPMQVRVADLAARKQCTVDLGHVDLAGLAAQHVDARVKRAVATARSVNRQRAYHQRGF